MFEYEDVRFFVYDERRCDFERLVGLLVFKGGRAAKLGLGDGVWW